MDTEIIDETVVFSLEFAFCILQWTSLLSRNIKRGKCFEIASLDKYEFAAEFE